MRNNRAIGGKYEDIASDYLCSNGMHEIERNFRCKLGEIDLIMRDEDNKYLVFVEVKYRTGNRGGTSLEAVTPAKRRTIVKVASYYMIKHGLPDNTNVRFDVVGIDGSTITHIKNAFGT